MADGPGTAARRAPGARGCSSRNAPRPGRPAGSVLLDSRAHMLVAARFVVLDATTVLEDGAVSIRRGRVERVGSRARLLRRRGRAEKIANFPDGIVLPGLVNAHVHLELSAIDG